MDLPMNKLILMVTLFCGLATKTTADESFVQSEASKRVNQEILNDIAQATEANGAMSDDALLTYLKDMFKYMPEEFETMVNKNPQELSLILDNFRMHHSSLGINIPKLLLVFEEEPFLKEFMAQTWAEDTVGYAYAKSVLDGLPIEQYQTIFQIGKQLAESTSSEKWLFIYENFPGDLSFLSIAQISYQHNDTEIYLYRGIGSYKRAGFRVFKNTDGQWSLDQFNYMESMEHQPIDITAFDFN